MAILSWAVVVTGHLCWFYLKDNIKTIKKTYLLINKFSHCNEKGGNVIVQLSYMRITDELLQPGEHVVLRYVQIIQTA